FCDVRRDTYNLDPHKIPPLITEKTKAILPVHLFGQCADMDEINVIAKRNGLYVIEDACQAAGAWYKGRMAGSLSDAACFSFFPTKNLSCAGDGGMLVTDYGCVADIARGLRAHGSGAAGRRAAALLEAHKRRGSGHPCRDDSNEEAPREEQTTSQDKYHNYLIGRNSRLDEVQAAILRVKLKQLDDYMERRRAGAGFYGRMLDACPRLTLPYTHTPSAHAWHMYVLLYEERDRLREHLAQKGIATGVYYPVPLHLQPAFAPLGYKEGDMPEAEYLARRALAIPLYPQLTEMERWYIADGVKEFCV
ncbi:MAG: DegT/DnrJ/EryC1/StrS family aminotransferase, partial [Acetanaerobacterium sp.]